jgi:hypothetical protein
VDDVEATTLILEALFDIRAGVDYLVSVVGEEDDNGSEEAEED